jgi:hypothetical protein
MAMEEQHNSGLPLVQPITDQAEYERRFKAAVTEYQTFLGMHKLLPMGDLCLVNSSSRLTWVRSKRPWPWPAA